MKKKYRKRFEALINNLRFLPSNKFNMDYYYGVDEKDAKICPAGLLPLVFPDKWKVAINHNYFPVPCLKGKAFNDPVMDLCEFFGIDQNESDYLFEKHNRTKEEQIDIMKEFVESH